MKQSEYFDAFKKECEAQVALTEAKNRDYAGSENAFANFELIEILTAGRVTTEDGILVRMSDKLKRVANLLAREAAVKDEAITDTLRDLSVYAEILKIRLDSKAKTSQLQNSTAMPELEIRSGPLPHYSGPLCSCASCERRRFVDEMNAPRTAKNANKREKKRCKPKKSGR